MKGKYFITIILLTVLVVSPGLVSSNLKTSASTRAVGQASTARQGAWLDSLVFTKQDNPEEAIAQLQSDGSDVYASAVTDPALFQTVLEDARLTHTESYGSYNELTFNPYGPTFDDGRLNPFSNARIREAMNWLIDRDKIAQEVFGGLAIPQYTAVQPTGADYERYRSIIEGIEASYAYSMTQAQTAITTEMLGMGANLEGGAWFFNSAPVTVTFIIRVEDQRLPIGDYVSDQLETIGFAVDRQYKNREDASKFWLKSDPALGLWHIYTGGWVNTSISRDDATNFGYFYTPRGSGGTGDMLWPEYAPTAQFDELCEKLWVNNFTTLSERATLFEQVLALAMNDKGPGSVGAGSLHVWLVERKNFTPLRTGVTMATDLVGRWANMNSAGVASTDLFPHVARFTGEEGGILRLAQPDLLIEPWNPIAGSTWAYDQFPMRATTDLATLDDPNTGLPLAQRIESAECVVKAGLPITSTLDWLTLSFSPTITVPADAWADWDAASQTFIAAGDIPEPILEANTKCTITYPLDLFDTINWHDGSPLSTGDFIMRMIMQFDRGKPESDLYDESYMGTYDGFMSHFRGLTIDSEIPLVITTYDDQWWLDAELIAQSATWWPSYTSIGRGKNPGAWHALTPAIRAEAAGELAFSVDKAGLLGIPWTDFIGGPSLDILKNWMNQSASQDYIPYSPTLGSFVNAAEADARWTALQTWYSARYHFWLGTGPFYLEQVSYDPKSITLAHFADYPDAAGRWDAFAAPAQPEIAINHPAGSPGSYFNITGTGFPPDSTAFIVINETLLGNLPVNSSGSIAFTLSTNTADLGIYHLRVSANPSAGVQFMLKPDLPLLEKEGSLTEIAVPDGLAVKFYTSLLPMVFRN